MLSHPRIPSTAAALTVSLSYHYGCLGTKRSYWTLSACLNLVSKAQAPRVWQGTCLPFRCWACWRDLGSFRSECAAAYTNRCPQLVLGKDMHSPLVSARLTSEIASVTQAAFWIPLNLDPRETHLYRGRPCKVPVACFASWSGQMKPAILNCAAE